MKKFHYETGLEEIIVGKKKSPFSYSSHFHNLLEIAYCFSGRQMVTVGDALYELEAGDAILIFPYTMHEYSSNSQTVSTAILCNVNTPSRLFPELLTAVPVSPVIRAKNISKKAVRAFSEILESHTALEKLGWAYIILSELLKKVELYERKNLGVPELLVSIIAYINDNFTEQLSISTLAKKFAYSQSYIAHLFCDQLKMPFKTYLNSVRCEYAANQLIYTKKSIAVIALEAGYNSINTFCRCFKTRFNQTPSQYRNEYLKSE